jgi:hypothetical protein
MPSVNNGGPKWNDHKQGGRLSGSCDFVKSAGNGASFIAENISMIGLTVRSTFAANSAMRQVPITAYRQSASTSDIRQDGSSHFS